METADDEQTMGLREILTNYIDGDGIGWPAEFAFLRTFHAHKIADITASVAREGFKEPIFLGTDGRIWDGHHRLAVAEALNYGELPVLFGDESDA
jgi:ParB-like chromosome segregation protein Spo0J